MALRAFGSAGHVFLCDAVQRQSRLTALPTGSATLPQALAKPLPAIDIAPDAICG
ncbi:hypothetical protein [Roseiflexus castenholzii]|uniref:hypothetical protein n=1 Tax=Roseiflexus castenholzii TaxID=120962 RepID=UPI0002E10D54|nr:hypothetical protein [Roseiflexus castenholzii]